MSRNVANSRPRRTVGRSRTTDASPKFVPLANLRKLRECQQVAAVCYRVRNDSVEFLLVRTRGGRWIFPKGNAEPGLTHAQAAALEAFEEAGVHGRIEEACFSRYSRRKESNSSERASQCFFFVASVASTYCFSPNSARIATRRRFCRFIYLARFLCCLPICRRYSFC